MKGYTGYLLNETDRSNLAAIFPPKHQKFIGHHITTKFGVTDEAIPEPAKHAEIVGYASEEGLEAFIVSINGTTSRTDGRTLHITWSLNPKTKKPVDSNKLIEVGNWQEMEPIPINLEAKFFPF